MHARERLVEKLKVQQMKAHSRQGRVVAPLLSALALFALFNLGFVLEAIFLALVTLFKGVVILPIRMVFYYIDCVVIMTWHVRELWKK